MRIAVIGSAGLVGSKLINKLREMGHDVTASATTDVDAATAAELLHALVGSRVVVDVANSPSFGETAVKRLPETSTHALFAAEKAAGVTHHVALCVVGTDDFLANACCYAPERIPYTILRSTQFFEVIGDIATLLSDGRTVRATSTCIRPIGSDDVVTTLAEIAVGEPVNGVVEIAGPEQFHLDDLLRRLMKATGDRRVVITERDPPSVGAPLLRPTLAADSPNIIGTTRFTDWVAYSAGHAPMPTTGASPDHHLQPSNGNQRHAHL